MPNSSLYTPLSRQVPGYSHRSSSHPTPTSPPHTHTQTHPCAALKYRPQVLTRTHKQKAVAEKLAQEITKKMENRSHEEKFQKNSRQEKQFRLIELKNGNIQSMMPRECGPGFSYLLSHRINNSDK